MSDFIPHEIQLLILKLLPVKSLLRYRCVCKWWKEFIDSPAFTLDHLALQNPRFLIKYNDPEFLVLDPHTLPLVHTLQGPIEDDTQWYALFGTLHGVVCLYDHGTNILLWNPSIRKFSTLPSPSDFQSSFFNALQACYGFWIDPSTKEFKIIVLFFNERGEEVEYVDVNGFLYSSFRNDWRVISPREVGKKWCPGSAGPLVMIGGVAHWESWYELPGHQGKFIMSFDFRQESFDFIEMPNLKDMASFQPRLCLWQGTLSILYGDPYFPHRCYIYSRREGSWINMFDFEVSAPIAGVFYPLEGRGTRALVEEEEDELRGKLVLYDTRAGFIPLTCESRYHYASYDFVESLLFP